MNKFKSLTHTIQHTIKHTIQAHWPFIFLCASTCILMLCVTNWQAITTKLSTTSQQANSFIHSITHKEPEHTLEEFYNDPIINRSAELVVQYNESDKNWMYGKGISNEKTITLPAIQLQPTPQLAKTHQSAVYTSTTTLTHLTDTDEQVDGVMHKFPELTLISINSTDGGNTVIYTMMMQNVRYLYSITENRYIIGARVARFEEQMESVLGKQVVVEVVGSENVEKVLFTVEGGEIGYTIYQPVIKWRAEDAQSEAYEGISAQAYMASVPQIVEYKEDSSSIVDDGSFTIEELYMLIGGGDYEIYY